MLLEKFIVFQQTSSKGQMVLAVTSQNSTSASDRFTKPALPHHLAVPICYTGELLLTINQPPLKKEKGSVSSLN